MQSRSSTTWNVRPQQHSKQRTSKFESGDGIDFIRCRICSKHLRVLSGSHLRIHGIDRETMEEYQLSPDKMCSKEFRRLHSRRCDYYPYSKRNWVTAIRKLYKTEANVRAGYLQDTVQPDLRLIK